VAAARADPGTPTVAYPISKSRFPALGFSIEIVRLSVPFNPSDTASDVGEKVQVAAWGKPLHARATVPLKLLAGAALTTNVADDPAVTVAAELDALKPPVGAITGNVIGDGKFHYAIMLLF